MKLSRMTTAVFASLALAWLACAPAEVPSPGTSDHALWSSAHTAALHAPTTRERSHGKSLFAAIGSAIPSLVIVATTLGFARLRSPVASSFCLPLRARAPPHDQLV